MGGCVKRDLGWLVVVFSKFFSKVVSHNFEVCVYNVVILLAKCLVFRDKLNNKLSSWVRLKHLSLKSTEFFIESISLHELIVNDFKSVIVKSMRSDFPQHFKLTLHVLNLILLVE